jgi:hypothetical protein
MTTRLPARSAAATISPCGSVLRVDEELPGRGTPVLLDVHAQVVGQGGEPGAVPLRGDPYRVGLELLLGEPVRVLPTRGDERVDERVTVLSGDARQRVGPLDGPDVVAGVAKRAEQRHGARRGVEADSVADPGVLGRVGGQHQHDTAVGGRDGAQPGVAHRESGHAGRAFGVGDVDRQAVPVGLLERERHGDQPAVELGHRDLGGDVERARPVVTLRPGGAAAGQAQALQDRHVRRGEFGDVPGLVVAACGGRRGLGAPGCEHGDDQRVGAVEQLQQFGLGLPQRRAVHRQRARVGVLEGGAQCLDVSGVPGELLCAVVQDRDRRAVHVSRRAVQQSPGRQLQGRVEAVAGEQQGVRQERVQLGEVDRPALRQVDVCLRGNPGGHRRVLHHLCIGRLLAAESDHRPP